MKSGSGYTQTGDHVSNAPFQSGVLTSYTPKWAHYTLHKVSALWRIWQEGRSLRSWTFQSGWAVKFETYKTQKFR